MLYICSGPSHLNIPFIDESCKAMTCNILVSRPLFGTTAMRAGGYAQKLIYYAVYDAIGRQNLNKSWPNVGRKSSLEGIVEIL